MTNDKPLPASVRTTRALVPICWLVLAGSAMAQQVKTGDDAERLIAAMLAGSPVVDDLRELTDTIGGRVTGSDANRQAVAWAARKFREAEVAVSTEDFEMPATWEEDRVAVTIDGDVAFEIDAVAKPFSSGADELTAPLLDGGTGTVADFERLGDAAAGAWVLIETPLLDDEVGLHGLFALYGDARRVETNAIAAGVAGLLMRRSRVPASATQQAIRSLDELLARLGVP